MEKLNQIIEQMALAKFTLETNTDEKRLQFIIDNSTISDFVNYFNTNSHRQDYGHCKLRLMLTSRISVYYCQDVLWKKLKDDYIEDAVKGLEQKVEQTYKITIEQL